MQLTLENLIIAIFVILPGFISGVVHMQLDATKRSSAGEWIAESVVTSLFLNAISFCILIILQTNLDFSRNVRDIYSQLGTIPTWVALVYFCVLYLLAVLWGILGGVVSAWGGHKLFGYRLRLTPISGVPNTFIDALDSLVHTRENLRLRGDPRQQIPWLRVLRADMVILGRMQKSSEEFKTPDPIEIFLSPAYVFKNGHLMTRESKVSYGEYLRGLYLRLRPEDVIEVFVTPANWRPVSSLGAVLEES